ncbi:MAG: metal-transporting ATPase, partial [Lachnospiraceae bacterium]|nr:metal-transporting ATPase [Lachnospiraceae bacterium]
LTGESIPVDKTEGDKVSAATINREGMLKCRAERVGEDTTLSQIIELVANAAATKAPIARIADRVSGIFVPAVIAIAMAVTLGWLIAGESPAAALERGICVLVISCPCALGLATPVAIMVGSGKGAKNGILYKTGASLEQAGRTEIVALDKTGTITTGRPEVTGIYPAPGVGERKLLVKAASIEYGSEHPLAVAVTERARSEGIETEHVTDFMNHPGRGIEAGISGRLVHGGNREYIREYTSIDETEDLYRELATAGKTPIYFEEDGKLLGILAVADRLKSEAAEAVGELKRMGIRTVMLTGDNRETAEAIAKEAGIDEVAAGILPDGKEAEIRRLKKEGMTVMVGDGINDAPALAAADTGIAIGAGTDVAIDSADIVLMNSSVKDVAAAVRLGRATLKNIHENLFWAFFYNMICIPLAAGLFGMKMDPMLGAAAMSLSSFTVCMNALRLNGYRLYDPSGDRAVKRRDKKTEDKTIKEKGEKNMEKTVKIEGMMCGHCAASVKKALEELDFISGAEVSHETGTARITLTGEADTERIRQAIEEKDYKYIGIE